MCCLGGKESRSERGTPGPIARRSTFPQESRTRVSSKRPATPTSPTAVVNTEQPKDDESIIKLFKQINTSITDHVFNYYISSDGASDKFSQFGKNKKELGWVLRAAASNSTLKEARTQVAVIRAIIGAEIFKAIRDGDFVPPTTIRPEARRQGMNTPAAHKSRLEFYQSLSRNHQYISHREKAISKLVTEIMKMTQPLAATDKGDELTRQKNLKGIIEGAADFAVIIGKQRPSFEIIFPPIPTAKSSGNQRSAQQGRNRKSKPENLDMPVLIPELRKYGDERGANYDDYLTLVPVQKLPDGL